MENYEKLLRKYEDLKLDNKLLNLSNSNLLKENLELNEVLNNIAKGSGDLENILTDILNNIKKTIKKKHSIKKPSIRETKILGGELFTKEQMLELIKQHEQKCYYCRKKIPISRLQPEHKIPLSKGGSNSIDNIVPTCWTCNKLKYTLTDEEYMQTEVYKHRLKVS